MSNQPINADVTDTSIRVSHELADRLFELKKKRGESYEDVIWRLIEIAEGQGEV